MLSPAESMSLRALGDTIVATKPGARIYGSPLLNEIFDTGPVGKLIGGLLGPAAKPVRAIMFDKSPETNWALGWHQDRTIAVRARVEVAGFGPWTVKAGRPHVEPPFEVIGQMVTLRLHLDDVTAENAPLLIVPGSHKLGRIPAAKVSEIVAAHGQMTCLAEAGDSWVYATSILHASDKAVNPRHRRVLQVDFSALDLPGGLQWAGIDSFSPA
jgi:hypothetical protein